MIALVRREFHQFQAAGRDFLYLVPSAAVFELDAPCAAVLLKLAEGRHTEDSVIASLADRFPASAVTDAISELTDVRAIGYEQQPTPADETRRMLPMMPFPLTTMVLNVTNQCNLACTYCYEYGEDKIVDTEHGQQSKFMSRKRPARASSFCSARADASRT